MEEKNKFGRKIEKLLFAFDASVGLSRSATRLVNDFDNHFIRTEHLDAVRWIKWQQPTLKATFKSTFHLEIISPRQLKVVGSVNFLIFQGDEMLIYKQNVQQSIALEKLYKKSFIMKLIGMRVRRHNHGKLFRESNHVTVHADLRSNAASDRIELKRNYSDHSKSYGSVCSRMTCDKKWASYL